MLLKSFQSFADCKKINKKVIFSYSLAKYTIYFALRISKNASGKQLKRESTFGIKIEHDGFFRPQQIKITRGRSIFRYGQGQLIMNLTGSMMNQCAINDIA